MVAYEYKFVHEKTEQSFEQKVNVFGRSGWRVHTCMSSEGRIRALLEKAKPPSETSK
jgi:hypothetical protein